MVWKKSFGINATELVVNITIVYAMVIAVSFVK